MKLIASGVHLSAAITRSPSFSRSSSSTRITILPAAISAIASEIVDSPGLGSISLIGLSEDFERLLEPESDTGVDIIRVFTFAYSAVQT